MSDFYDNNLSDMDDEFQGLLKSNENREKTPEFVPKRIFIVPYKKRLEQKFFYSKHMSFILEDCEDYEIYFSHQCDSRNFNRGATKNIGFLVMKEKYPDNYKDITFIFNDIDTVPFHKLFNYQTKPGIIKHYYGFEYALGGIVVIKGEDFEKINGFPNFWGWGNEDRVLQIRSERHNLKIDRSKFYHVGSPEILQLFDGVSRLVTPKEYHLGKGDSGADGLSTIHRLTFIIDHESINPKDNEYVVENERIYIINILSFLTGVPYDINEYYEYDLRDPTSKIIRPDNKPTNKTAFHKEDLKNIQYHPMNTQNMNHPINMGNRPVAVNNPHIHAKQMSKMPLDINVFSPEYANYVGVKPRAMPSVNISMGKYF